MVAGVGLAVPAAASADTFWVDHAGCTGAGHKFTTIGGALTAAAGNGSGTLDTIEVGPGTYDEDLANAAGNPVNIVGSGDSTDIAPSSNANNQNVLSIGQGSTSVSSVKITIPAGSGNTGISVAQTIGAHGPSFSHVDVVENASATDGTGALLYGSSFSSPSAAARAEAQLRLGQFASPASLRVIESSSMLRPLTTLPARLTLTHWTLGSEPSTVQATRA